MKITSTKLGRLFSIIILLLVISCEKDDPDDSGQINPDPITPPSLTEGFVLTFSDEFDGTALDKSKWHPNLPWDWGTATLNNEKQAYVEDNLSISNGTLKIKMEKRNVSALKDGVMTSFDYASGAISSTNQFYQKYGLFEIRAKLPSGGGTWPAFWLMPENNNIWAPYGAEIDIFEHFTAHGSDIQSGMFFDGYGNQSKHWVADLISLPSYSSGFHTYSYIWNPKELKLYIDGLLKATYNKNSTPGLGIAIPSTEEYIIINAALGGFGGTIDNSLLPDFFELDYVRVYQYEDYSTIKSMEDDRLGLENFKRYTFEDATIDEILSLYAHGINTDIISLATHRATIANGTADQKTEVLTGNASLKADSRGVNTEFNEIFVTPTNQFLANSDYSVTINYRQVSLFSDAKIYAQIKAESDDNILKTYDFIRQNRGRAKFSFNTGNQDDYVLIIGILNKGGVIIDDILIDGPDPGSNFGEGSLGGGSSSGGTSGGGSTYNGTEDFESITIQEILDDSQSNFASEQVELIRDTNEVINGTTSLKCDTNNTDNTWNEFYHSPLGRIKPNTTQTITFEAKNLNLENGASFYALIREKDRTTNNAPDFAWSEWTDVGIQKTITLTGDIGDFTNYYLIVGVQGKGSIIIDNVKIE